MFPHQPDPSVPDPPRQARDSEPLPSPAQETTEFRFPYDGTSLTAYLYSEAGDLLAIETYQESGADSPDVILVELSKQTWTYTYSLEPDYPEPQP